jgi:hypothetical protein
VMPIPAVEASGSATVVSTSVPTLATAGTLRRASTPNFGYLKAYQSALMSSGTNLKWYLFW